MAHARLALALVVLVAGCDYVLGLRSFNATPDAPGVIVNKGTVTVTYTWFVATADAAAHPHITPMPAPTDELDIKAELVDGTNLPVVRMADGSAMFQLPPGAPYVLVTQDKNATYATELQTTSATIDLARLVYDHDATFATQPTPVTFDVQLQQQPLAGVALVASLGVRTFTVFDAGTVSDATLDWRNAIALGGKGPLLSGTVNHDRLIYERFLDNGMYQYVADADVEVVDMTDGVGVQIGSVTARRPVAQLALERCVHVVAPRATELARVEAQAGVSGNPAADWAIESHLDNTLPQGYTFQLAAGTTPIADESLDVHYGSPYDGEVDAVTLGVAATRSIAYPGSLPLDLYYGSNMYVIPPDTTCGPVTFSPTALYASGTLGGTALADDGVVVMLDRSAPVPFVFTMTPEPYVDIPMALFEVEDAAGATVLRPVRAYEIVGGTSVNIDPTLLARNHYYIFKLTPRTGFVDAPRLDFRMFAYPAGTTTSFSKMFKIGN